MDYRQRWEHKEYVSGRRLEHRVVLFHACLFLLALSFLLDFWNLQMVRGDEFARQAENNRLRKIPLEPTRGVIIDRNGEVLASTRPSLSLVLRREEARSFEDQLQRLAPIVGVSYETLTERLHEMRFRPLFEPLVLQKDARLQELAWIEARREWFPSVEVQELARRSYPHAGVAAHALGYVGQISEKDLEKRNGESDLQRGDIVGKAGVERRYDDRLRGRRGWKFVSVNTLGRQLAMGPSRVGSQPRDGQGVRLNLDLRLQRILVDALGEETGAGVFIDPTTGEVLALASSPSYNPNAFADGISHEEWRAIQGNTDHPLHDRVTGSFYAPGSTFKVVLAVAGLETGTITSADTVHCTGSVRLYGRRFLCWKRGGHGTVDLRRALAFSCNVYFYELGQRLGVDKIHRYGAMFNLGRPTAIDLPGEGSGILPSSAWKQEALRETWYPGDTISVSIGQGLLAVTPIQMAVMISAVATGGAVPQPRIVSGQDSGEPVRRNSFSPATLNLVRTALEDAVNKGTARTAALDGIQVAGKTGTAQLYKHSAGIDADELPKAERDHAWFVGYAPAEAPRVAFAIVVEHGGHGGTTAAPIARKVLKAFFANDASTGRGAGPLRAGGASPQEETDVRAPASR